MTKGSVVYGWDPYRDSARDNGTTHPVALHQHPESERSGDWRGSRNPRGRSEAAASRPSCTTEGTNTAQTQWRKEVILP